MKRNPLLIPAMVTGGLLALGALSLVDGHDRALEEASLERYCEDAAVWAYEDAQGVPVNQRTGQPDYRGIAAEQCPGMRPAGPAWELSPGRQVAEQ